MRKLPVREGKTYNSREKIKLRKQQKLIFTIYFKVNQSVRGARTGASQISDQRQCIPIRCILARWHGQACFCPLVVGSTLKSAERWRAVEHMGAAAALRAAERCDIIWQGMAIASRTR